MNNKVIFLLFTGKAYIKCEKITDMCLYVLNDSRLTKAIGDSYLTLLLKDVLPCEYYLGFISPSTWKGEFAFATINSSDLFCMARVTCR